MAASWWPVGVKRRRTPPPHIATQTQPSASTVCCSNIELKCLSWGYAAW
jgi:hypothetical protein